MVAVSRWVSVAVVLALVAPPVAADDAALSRTQLARLGKAATALVEVGGPRRGSGSAFCVHTSGLFITNAHVVPAQVNEVVLVLGSGTKNQRVLKARVVRRSPQLDLAVLRAADAKDLAVLPLGADDDLSELMEVVAFGFPFGRALSSDQQEYPAVSVNVGSITSLRRRGGALYRIQLDAALNPGNSGGPVLDGRGKVVGVVVEGIRGAGVNFAIPVHDVARFLALPELAFIPPTLDHQNVHRPALFQARAASLLPSDRPPELELLLRAGGAERRYPMERSGDRYRVTAVPVPPPTGSAAVRVGVRYGDGMVVGTVKDQAVRVGGESFRLAEVRSLQWRPEPRAVLQNGKTVRGAVTGLGELSVGLGGQTVVVDASKAVEVVVAPPATVTAVDCTVVVRRDGRELGRLHTFIPVAGPAPARNDLQALGSLKAPPLDKDRAVRPLAGAVADVAVGGGGRFLILHLAGVKKLAVFDVEQARVVKALPVTENAVRFAAGATRLVLLYPSARLLQVWNLSTLEKERSAPLPADLAGGEVGEVCMGSASAGPLFAYLPRQKRTLALDLDRLESTEVRWSHFGPGNAYGPAHLRASADGGVLLGWGGGWAGVEMALFEGGKLSGTRDKIAFSLGAFALPSADGQQLFVPGAVVTRDLAAANVPALKDAYLVPAHEPGFFLALGPSGQPRPAGAGAGLNLPPVGRVAVYTDDRTRLFDLDCDELKAGSDLPWEKAVHYYPRAGVLVTLAGRDQLVLRRVDLVARLNQTGADYLLALSRPPAARAGRPYSYRLDVRCKKGGLKVALESGPAGLRVTPDGQVTWAVPGDFDRPEADVLLTLSDASGQEVFHRFKIPVARW
jgi:hypothetical protein